MSAGRTAIRLLTWAALALLAFGCLAVAAAVYWQPSLLNDGSARDQMWHAAAWRVQLFARKSRGVIPDLSWRELWQMTRVRGGFGMGDMMKDGQSLEGSVTNPYIGEDDVRAGARIFEQRCTQCHGSEGNGWHGPPLNRSGLKYGDSDLALYRTIRDGVAGTAMPALGLTMAERWQVIAYVRKVQRTEQETLSESGEAPRLHIAVSAGRIRAAGSRTDEWLTYSGSLDGRRYSPLAQITAANVAQLRTRWVAQFDIGEQKIEATPLVVDDVMFVTTPPASVVALRVGTGEVLWTYTRDVSPDARLCCGHVNRGLAILDHVLFFGAIDGFLVAIDANTGRMLWQTQVAEASAGYTLTGAPLVVDDSVVIGVAGGEFAIRGFVAAYSATTGRERWKFFTVPGPGEAGHETWGADSWRTGGGPTWNTGSFDPSLGLVYWGVGNPAPVFTGESRRGDNLYTNSVVALDAKSGKLAWYFQFTPHDEHDWDSTQTPILADIVVKGVQRKVICWANRNGFYYVLDRVSGEFLGGRPFVEVDWTNGLDEKGRPIPMPTSDVSRAGRLIRPGVAGATNWQNAAFDARLGLVFIPATEGASVFTKAAQPRRGDRGTLLGSAGSLRYPVISAVRAVDAATGANRWERVAPSSRTGFPTYGGLLATGGGLVFGATGGYVFALDAASGKELWRVPLGGETLAAPISFTVEGGQVIAVSAGRAMFVFGL